MNTMNETLLAEATAPELNELTAAEAPAGEIHLSMLLDLTLPISIELGRTTMTVQEILALGRGSVIELERYAGEPIDIYVSERRFAQGEVVVLGDVFGVRITRVVNPSAVTEAV
jgi:flagellar motor switch protein FliN/FliY